VEWNNAKEQHAGSNTYTTKPIWKHLWKLKIPPKQANLIWWILQQAIPIRDNLTSKGIRCSPLCPRCNKALETIDHVFIHCEWTKAAWFRSPLTINFQTNYQGLSLCDCLSNIILKESAEEVEMVISIIYHIWRARNEFVFQNKDLPFKEVVKRACASTSDYRKLCISQNKHHRSSEAQVGGHNKIWSPPAKDTLKLNVDANPCGDGRWGFGLVLRTEDGRCVGSTTRVARGSEVVVEGEALGLNAAIEFAESNNLHRVTFEIDSLTVINAMRNRRYPRNYWGKIARRCNAFLDQHPLSNVNWICRSGNQAADALAKWASREPNRNWINEPPTCIVEIIQKDNSLL
jgi:ribonuclease HI